MPENTVSAGKTAKKEWERYLQRTYIGRKIKYGRETCTREILICDKDLDVYLLLQGMNLQVTDVKRNDPPSVSYVARTQLQDWLQIQAMQV